MDSKLILNKIQTLHKEYRNYKEFYEVFQEGVDERKMEMAKKLTSKDFEKDLEEFVLDSFVLNHIYASDLDILVDKLITYVNAARLIGLEEEVDPEVISLIKKYREKEIKPRFIIEQGKPIEIAEGFVEEQRKLIREQGNIKTLIQKLTK